MNLKLKATYRNKYIISVLIITIIAIIVCVGKAMSNANDTIGVKYRAHVAYYGWLNWNVDGEMAGTTGESRRMEAIKIKLTGNIPGDVVYQVYVRDKGWQNEVKNSQTAGTVGESKQMEAIKIKLTGEIANTYDIKYRVHLKSDGWQEWVSNGAMSGSDIKALRIEAIEIKLVQKAAAGENTNKDEQDAEVKQQQQQEQEQPQQQQQQEQPQQQQEKPQEQPQQQQEQPQQQSESPFRKYADLSEVQLKGLARLCQQEQGTAKGAAAEASLMANHMDLGHCNARKYEKNGTGLYNYVRNGGWFAHAGKFMDMQNPREDVLVAVRKVFIEGKRTLPGYVVEHDCFSDISSATNDGVAIDKRNRSSYVQFKTSIKNTYGGNYIFYCFPTDTSDPFGYEKESLRQQIGDFCYKYEDL